MDLFCDHLDTTDSTMFAIEHNPFALRQEEYVVCTASYQMAGHGQMGTHWHSAYGKNLLFTLRIRPCFLNACNQFLISQATALSLLPPFLEATVKWPNDIYVGRDKLCGILIKHSVAGGNLCRTLIGVGVNVNQQVFPPEVLHPTSYALITGNEIDCASVLNNFLSRFSHYYELLKAGNADEIRRTYAQKLYRRTGYHNYCDREGWFSAEIVDVEHNGRLVLRDDRGGMRRYAFKEVVYCED